MPLSNGRQHGRKSMRWFPMQLETSLNHCQIMQQIICNRLIYLSQIIGIISRHLLIISCDDETFLISNMACWLIINGILGHSPNGNFTGNTYHTSPWVCKITYIRLQPYPPVASESFMNYLVTCNIAICAYSCLELLWMYIYIHIDNAKACTKNPRLLIYGCDEVEVEICQCISSLIV